MPSPFHGIHTASSALRAFQRALDVTGNNISNVNTPGYTRQRVEFRQTEPTQFTYGSTFSLGNGVQVGSINRIRDMFLEARRIEAGGSLGRSIAFADRMDQVQRIFQEPGGNSIGDGLTKFFNAWSGLAANPGEPGLRSNVQMAGQTLADRIRGTYDQLQTLEQHVTGEVEQTLSEIGNLTETIAQLNEEIRQKNAYGYEPNDLHDLRDTAIRQLGELVDIQTYKFEDGSITVYANQLTLVDPTGAQPVPTTFNPTTNTLSNGVTTFEVRGGRLRGMFDTLNSINDTQGRLDTLANTLRTQVNSLHMGGTTASGATGLRFFNDVTTGPQTGAIDFNLDATGLVGPPAVPGVANDPNSIVAGSGAASDGGIAIAISRLRDVAVGALGTRSFTAFYADLVGDVGRTTAFGKSNAETQDAVMAQIENQIQSVSGVNLDEEMANMLRFQRSYQAAARALNMFDQMTQELINMVR
jgi:flagellar hook-associated protein 1 FlgK